MHETTDMRRGRVGVLIAGLMLGVASTAAATPATAVAPGWQAFIGCWEPIAAPVAALADTARAHLVCIVPVEGSSAVDMVTVVDGRVVERERVDATGTPSPVQKDDCAGTRSAAWSAVGQRLYVRSEMSCAGLRRTSTGVISMATIVSGSLSANTALSSAYEWTDVQTVTVGEQKAVRVLRYREARQGAAIPAEIIVALGRPLFSVSTARLAATAPVTSADIIDVSRHLDAAGLEVWLLEQKLAFTADAKRIVELTKAGVPGSAIDVVVALSYPRRFTIDANQRQIAMRPGEPVEAARMRSGYDPLYDPMYDPRLDPYFNTRYGSRYYSPYGYSQYGYGYGGRYNGWYPGQRPVVIVVTNPTPGEPAVQGRAVKGVGYTRNRPAAPAADRSSSGSSTGSGSSSTGSSSTGSSSTGSTGTGSTGTTGSSSGETGRTAKVRPPPSGN